MQLTHDERRRIKSRVSMTLTNLAGPVRLYWLPALRRLAARSVIVKKKAFRLPADAILLGTYQAPFPASLVLEDLVDLLARAPCLARVAGLQPAQQRDRTGPTSGPSRALLARLA